MKTSVEKKQRTRRWRDLLAEVPLMTLLSVASVYPFVTALELQLSPWQLVAACLVLIIPLSVLLFYARTAILTGIAASLLAVAATALLLFSGSETVVSLRVEIDSFINWAVPYLKGVRTDILHYCRLMGLIFTALVTVPICLFTVRRMDAFAALLPGFSIIAALFIIGHTIPMAAVFAYLAVALLYFAYHRFRRYAKAFSQGHAPSPLVFLASVLPVALAVMTTAMLLSSTVKIDPAWMKDAREKLLQKETQVAEAVVKQSGGVSTNELGGVPAQNDTVMMKVITDTYDVYLKGISKDVYTGHSWERSDTSKTPFYSDSSNFPDTRETMTRDIQSSGLSGQAGEAGAGSSLFMPSTFTGSAISIEYVNLSSPLVYLPLKTEMVVLPETTQPSLVGGDTVMLGATAAAGFSYTATYLAIGSELDDLLAQSYKGYYNQIGGSAQELFGENAEAAYNACVKLPESLPQRVRQLADQITAGATNDYEKAKAIEAYLSGNYTYTLTPGVFDKSRDFVDQFLFENQRGYCTYFATAMAVLLRCEGIPSRYVEGYVLPAGKTDGAYHVTNRQGHAWVEAYFEGVGWIQFEPTGAYAGGARPSTSQVVTQSPSPAPSQPATPKPSSQPVIQQPKPGGNVAARFAYAWLPWAAAILLLFLAVAAVAYGLHKRAGQRMQRLAPKEATIKVFGQCLQILSKCGFAPKNGESLHDFARRAEKGCVLQAHCLSCAAETFQLARFSTHQLSEDQKILMLDTREKLLLACKKKLGPIRHGIIKWLWG